MSKKNVQRIIVGVILAALLVLCGCGAKQSSAESNKLVGKWYSEQQKDIYFKTSSYNNSGDWYIRVLEFYENGKFIALTRDSYAGRSWVTYPGTYVICDDETVILYGVSDLSLKFRVSGNTLEMWNYGDQAYKDCISSYGEIDVAQFEKQ